jgi:hypothetical protein
MGRICDGRSWRQPFYVRIAREVSPEEQDLAMVEDLVAALRK